MRLIRLENEYEDLAQEIARERDENNAGKPDGAVVPDIHMPGARCEVACALWLNLDPYTVLDRSPVPDRGWDFISPKGARLQVRGTLEPYRGLLCKQSKWPPPEPPDYFILCWPDHEGIIIVGYLSRAQWERKKRPKRLKPRGPLNWFVPWREVVHVA